MENTNIQCSEGLLYNSFTVILMQTFVPTNIKSTTYKVVSNFVDNEIFTMFDDNLVKRYELPDFNIKIDLSTKERYLNSVEGRVKVQAAIYFNQAVSISYRFVVSNNMEDFCRAKYPFSTDELILLSGIVQGIEHWEKDKNGYTINANSYKLEISDLNIPHKNIKFTGEKSDFIKIQQLYKSLFTADIAEEMCSRDNHYTFVDVWENISHCGSVKYDTMTEAQIIDHIRDYHKPELIGLMSFYPFEWPFRTASDFDSMCGDNIAIDTDDFVLANENMALVFGTYGLRGEDAPTVWSEHLESRSIYHTSWIEFFILVELAIVKKSVMTYVLLKYNGTIDKVVLSNANNKLSSGELKNTINKNALLNIQLTGIISKLDIARYLRYMSHKHMYRKTCEKLALQEDVEQLDYIINNSDIALNNASNMRELKQANQTNLVLGVISVASLFEIVLTEADIPLFDDVGLNSISNLSGRLIIFITIALILWTIIAFIKSHFFSSTK